MENIKNEIQLSDALEQIEGVSNVRAWSDLSMSGETTDWGCWFEKDGIKYTLNEKGKRLSFMPGERLPLEMIGHFDSPEQAVEYIAKKELVKVSAIKADPQYLKRKKLELVKAIQALAKTDPSGGYQQDCKQDITEILDALSVWEKKWRDENATLQDFYSWAKEDLENA